MRFIGKLQFKIMLAVVLLLLVIIGGSMVYNLFYLREQAIRRTAKTIDMTFDLVRKSLVTMMKENVTGALGDYLTWASATPGIKEIRVIKGEKVINDPFLVDYGGKGLVLESEKPQDDLDRKTLDSGQIQTLVSGDLFRKVIPVLAEADPCLQCHDAIPGDVLGAISISTSLSTVREEINRNTRNAVILVLGSIVAVALALSILLSRMVVGPVRLLSILTARVGQGEYEVDIPIKRSDEIGQLAGSFNEMTKSLKDRTVEVEKNVLMLQNTNKELQSSQEKLIQSEKLASLGQLASSIAHDIKNPLGAISNSLFSLREIVKEYGESIGDSTVNEDDHREIAGDMRGIIKTISDSAKHANDVISNISSYTNEIVHATPKKFDVVRTLGRMRSILEHELKNGHCELSIEHRDGEIILYGESGKFIQVISNLVINSIHAYESNSSGKIELKACKEEDGIQIVVTDYGCGIAGENLGKIFDYMFTTKGSGEGTGLGLHIVKGMVEDHFGGEIDVTSQVGVGTTFTLKFPNRPELGVEESRAESSQTDEDLNKSQEDLIKSGEMASMGKLTAAIAHDLNTPLSAVMNSLSRMNDLVVEYKESIGDSQVNEDDHSEIAAEMNEAINLASGSVEKAVSFIKSIRSHTKSTS